MTMPERADRATPTNAYAPPKAPLIGPTGTTTSGPGTSTTPGQRIAGALFIVGAILFIIRKLVDSRPIFPGFLFDTRVPLSLWLTTFATFILPIAVIVIDIVLGAMLLAQKKRAVAWAMVRVLLGMLLLGVGQLIFLCEADLDLWTILWPFTASLSLFLLLRPNATKIRIIEGAALFGVYTVVSLWEIGVQVTGTNPLGAIIETTSGDIAGKPVKVVMGKAAPYKLTLPSDKWYLRANKPDAEHASDADRWISRPDVDAHVMVVVEDAQGTLLFPDEYADAAIELLKKENSVSLRNRAPLRTHPERGRMLHLLDYSDRVPTEWLVGTVATYGRGFLIYALASRQVFARIEPELRSIIESFELPPEEPLRAPDDCEKDPVSRIEGVARKYALTAPGENWFLRKSEAAKNDHADADRWIIRPDKAAHIMVIVERVDGLIDLEKYTDATIEAIESEMRETLISREALQSRPTTGRLLHTTAKIDGVKFEYLYGLFAEGSSAYQVIAYARTETFGQLKADFKRVIEQFELPQQNVRQ